LVEVRHDKSVKETDNAVELYGPGYGYVRIAISKGTEMRTQSARKKSKKLNPQDFVQIRNLRLVFPANEFKLLPGKRLTQEQWLVTVMI
jgi:hypothetical protein